MEVFKFTTLPCPQCGKDTPYAPYCLHCGALTDRKEIERPKVTCFFCGRSVPKGHFCVACGIDLTIPKELQD